MFQVDCRMLSAPGRDGEKGSDVEREPGLLMFVFRNARFIPGGIEKDCAPFAEPRPEFD